MPNEVLAGRNYAWNLLQKLGEGDAGEVYAVESLLDKRQAILKRPAPSAFTSDILRQASQIEREGNVLSLLANLDWRETALRVPGLIDRAKNAVDAADKYFIVMEAAEGIDLMTLARLLQAKASSANGVRLSNQLVSSSGLRSFLQGYALSGELPANLVVRILAACIPFLERIHSFAFNLEGEDFSGLIWNDFKPEHIYWDPGSGCITLIDWGNANFLNLEGVTSDRQASPFNDFIQLLQTFGNFIAAVAPQVYQELEWPEDLAPINAYSEGILPLKEKLRCLIDTQSAELNRIRLEERKLLESAQLTLAMFIKLIEVHQRIITQGELPDYAAAEDLASRLARELLRSRQLKQFTALCNLASQIPAFRQSQWHMLAEMTEYYQEQPELWGALEAALAEDYAAALWLLRPLAASEPAIRWWEELAARVREQKYGASPQAITPFTAFNRLLHAILSAVMDDAEGPEALEAHTEATRVIKDNLIPRWKSVEPDPPAAGIEYLELEELLPGFIALAPSAARVLEFALEMPRSQARIVLDNWHRQEFALASQALRHLLLWDPDRLRVFKADNAIQSASRWLDALQHGPDQDEPLQDYVTRLELQGRDLRNSVAPAAWLDERLNILARLRRESEPSDLIPEFPMIRDAMSWIFELESERPVMELASGPLPLDRLPSQIRNLVFFHGSKEAVLGSDFMVISPLDTWTPEARGSSARVFLGVIRQSRSREIQSAIKIMRPDRHEYALPLFREEVQVLTILQDTPGVVPLHEFGFIRLEQGTNLPPEEKPGMHFELHGKVKRYGRDSLPQFLANLDSFVSQDWLPYLSVDIQERSENLLWLCDSSYTRGRFLPVLEGLRMGIQICDILHVAHSRNIVYRDHKILHYYWRAEDNGIMMIDWNIAKRFPEGLTKPEIQFDLVQFCARALHHILTGRPLAGSLPLGPTRVEEIENAARSYPVRWTYDDQRIPKEIKEIMAAGMQGEYQDARQLRDDLFLQFQAYQPHTAPLIQPASD